MMTDRISCIMELHFAGRNAKCLLKDIMEIVNRLKRNSEEIMM